MSVVGDLIRSPRPFDVVGLLDLFGPPLPPTISLSFDARIVEKLTRWLFPVGRRTLA